MTELKQIVPVHVEWRAHDKARREQEPHYAGSSRPAGACSTYTHTQACRLATSACREWGEAWQRTIFRVQLLACERAIFAR